MGFPAQVVYVKLKGKKKLAKAEEVFKELLTAAIGLLVTISCKKSHRGKTSEIKSGR